MLFQKWLSINTTKSGFFCLKRLIYWHEQIFSISFTILLHWCSEVPPAIGERKSTIKKVCALKELKIKMPDCLGEVNELHGGKQLHSTLDMESLKTGDRKRRNMSHGLVSGLWLQLSRSLDHTWSKLLNTFGSNATSHDHLFISLPHAEFWVFHLQFITTKISYLHCSIFNIHKWVICGERRLLDWGLPNANSC